MIFFQRFNHSLCYDIFFSWVSLLLLNRSLTLILNEDSVLYMYIIDCFLFVLYDNTPRKKYLWCRYFLVQLNMDSYNWIWPHSLDLSKRKMMSKVLCKPITVTPILKQSFANGEHPIRELYKNLDFDFKFPNGAENVLLWICKP